MDFFTQATPRTLAELSLIVNGLIVFVLILFAVRFLRQRKSSEFREDLWDDSRLSPQEREAIKRVVDQIALGPPPEDDEVTEKLAREAIESDDVTAPGPKRPASTQPKPATSPYRQPNFRGRPHEVLGIPADASAELIQAAYKYWIKRFHPDRVQHLGPGYAQEAHRRSEALNSAKNALLMSRAASSK